MSNSIEEYKLSNEALGALMMTVQKALVAAANGDEGADLATLLSEWKLTVADGKVYVLNPPIVKALDPDAETSGGLLLED